MFSCGVWRVPPVVVENGVIVGLDKSRKGKSFYFLLENSKS